MDFTKNMFLAGFCSAPSFLTALETQTPTTNLVAVLVSVLLFIIGKTADVCVQIYFRRRQEKLEEKRREMALVRSEKVNGDADARTSPN